jgi:hypothetical protein
MDRVPMQIDKAFFKKPRRPAWSLVALTAGNWTSRMAVAFNKPHQ